jgi:hypothetical protein
VPLATHRSHWGRKYALQCSHQHQAWGSRAGGAVRIGSSAAGDLPLLLPAEVDPLLKPRLLGEHACCPNADPLASVSSGT